MILDFTTGQIIPLLPALILLGLAVVLFRKDKTKASLLLLVAGAFFMGLFAALLDPYLHIWDEQYHALVAKNMMDNLFYPVLYKNPVLSYDYTLWTDNHLWLHKQPLFLWQIAISMKIFGVNEIAVRLPSVIMHAIIPLFIYRTGKIALDKRTGFYAAFFFSLAYYPLELISGKYVADHNDISFLFYVTASFWAWFEYQRSKKGYWLLVIGLFAGCAVLVKWLMGLLVYICWTFTFFAERKKMLQWQTYLPFIKSFVVSLIVLLPWQIYILSRFPAESAYEYAAFSSHLFTPVEGHGGEFWVQIAAAKWLYGFGFLTPVFLLAAIIILFRKINASSHKVFTIGAILFVYIFYSVSATKMLSFCVIVSPLIYLGFVALFLSVTDFIEKTHIKQYLKTIFFHILLLVLSIFILDLQDIRVNHTMYRPDENDNRKEKLAERVLIKDLDNILPDKNYIIFNTRFVQGGNIPFMFYSDYIAYRFFPSKDQCLEVAKKGYKMAVLDFNDLPDYILNNKDIIKIPVSK